MKPRRVLIIVQNLPVPFDRRTWQEARALSANGYRVSVICPVGKGHDTRRETIDGIEIYRHPLPFEANGALGYLFEYAGSLFWEFVLAWRVFLTRGFDVIHACNPPDNLFLIGGFFKWFFGRKYIFDHHDINPELYEAKFGRRGGLYRILRWWERCSFRLADISLATNESYRKIAVERGGMDPGRVFIVRSGPDLSRLKSVPADPTWKKGRAYLVGYVGVMGQQEGIHYLIEAARHLVQKRQRHDIQFVLVGGGPSLAEMKALADSRGVADYVTFLGRVPDDVLLSVLNTAEVCVNPDEVNPMNDLSTMNKVMEYMALGKPVVQFDVTEGRVSAQEASLYAKANDAVDFGEKIAALLDDPAKREQMGRLGRARIEKELAWEHEEPKLLAAYATLFGETPER